MSDNTPQLNKLKSKELPAAFCAWVAKQDAGEAGIWLANLDEKGQANVANEMASFCEDAEFKLEWVTEEQITNAVLRSALENVVLHNLQAFHHASIIQPTLLLYKTTLHWLKDPSARTYRDDTRVIYTLLVERGVVPPASADVMLDSNRRRWQYVTNALQTAYQSDPNAVEHAVGVVILAEDKPEMLAKQKSSWWSFGKQTTPAIA